MDIIDFIVVRFNYWIYVVLMMMGLYAMIAKNNLIKKLIGMSIFQTAIILFYVSIGVKEGATIPILSHEILHVRHEHNIGQPIRPADKAERVNDGRLDGTTARIVVSDYANPLPHVLMLTAIVVGVSTLGVALAIVQKIHREYGSIEESEILEQIMHRNG